MPTYSFIQCDVFTDQVFGGNPLAVFPDGRGIDDATMQKIAREMNLSETVFVLPPTDETKALRWLRIFTPGAELPLAGHPVVGTWDMLARQGVVAPPASGTGRVEIHQELKVGVLPVAIEFASGAPVKVVMTQAAPRVGEPLNVPDQAARALSLNVDEIGFEGMPIVVSSTGVSFLRVPLRSRAALARINVNSSALGELLEPMAATGLYAITCETYSAEALVSTRMFAAPKTGVGEDPATGSAAGTLSAALVHYGVVAPVDGIARFIIEQGVDLGRPSRIEAEVEGARGVEKRCALAASRWSCSQARLVGEENEIICQNTSELLVAPPKAPLFVTRPSALKVQKCSAHTPIPKSRCTRLRSLIMSSVSLKMTGRVWVS